MKTFQEIVDFFGGYGAVDDDGKVNIFSEKPVARHYFDGKNSERMIWIGPHFAYDVQGISDIDKYDCECLLVSHICKNCNNNNCCKHGDENQFDKFLNCGAWK